MMSAAELPPLYQSWITDILPGPIARESKATCHDCVMCAPPDAPSSLAPFSRRIKCCTSVPRLPNFLCGRILLDRSPDAARGRQSLVERLGRRAGVTPLGIAAPPVREYLGLGTRLEAHGRALTLRCPHYLEDTGGCGIWRHREANCTTWFCRHVRGRTGLLFWEQLRQLLRAVEDDLARHWMVVLDIGDPALERLAPVPSGLGRAAPKTLLDEHDLDGGVDPAAYAARWGSWVGREVELYERCARLTEGLRWSQVLALCGPEVAIALKRVDRAYSATQSAAIPTTLRPGAWTVIDESERAVTLRTFSVLDPLTVPREVYAALLRFDGDATSDVIAAIQKEEGWELALDTIRELVDYGVLEAG
jgi:hypothetical protein